MKSRPALLLAASLGLLQLAPSLAGAAEDRPSARPQVGLAVEAAQQLLVQKQYRAGLDKLREADAVAGKTQYETYVIEATRAAIAMPAGDIPATMNALDAVLATGQLAPAEVLQQLAVLVRLAYRAGDTARLARTVERYDRAGGREREPHVLLAQAYYRQKDFAAAATACRALLQEDESLHRKPAESLLTLLVASAEGQGDEAGRIAALKRLVALYPKPESWRPLLLALRNRSSFPARLTLDLDRLLRATGAMDSAALYVEAAELALQAELPGEAKALLDAGFEAGLLGKGVEAERQRRLATMAARQAADTHERLPQRAAEAASVDSGVAWVRLGDAYASDGSPAEAAEALRKGIAAGGLGHPADAQLHRALALLAAEQPHEAGAILQRLAGDAEMADLAQLWLIEAGLD